MNTFVQHRCIQLNKSDRKRHL